MTCRAYNAYRATALVAYRGVETAPTLTPSTLPCCYLGRNP